MQLKFIRKGIYLISFLFLSTFQSFTQSKWNISLGNSLTQYDFVSSKGIPLDYFKQGSGTTYQIAYNQTFIDTLKLSGQSSSKAIYFLKRARLTKVLSKFTYEVGLLFNQLNAVGDVQNIAFDYQTNFIGLKASAGPQISLGKNWTVKTHGSISVQKILQGNQQVNATYVDLTQDPTFKAIQWMMGYEVTLYKQISNQIGFFIAHANLSTYKNTIIGQSNLNFTNQAWQIGVQISSLN